MSYYAVKIGKKPGVYATWDECLAQTKGVSGAQYKKFNTEEDACEFAGIKVPDSVSPSQAAEVVDSTETDEIFIYVDGSYQEKTDQVGYGLVIVKNDKALFKDLGKVRVEDTTSRQVIGEVQGALKAVELALANGISSITIVYDFKGIESWMTGEWDTLSLVARDYRCLMARYMSLVNVKFKKVKSHASKAKGGDKWNFVADKLAERAVLL